MIRQILLTMCMPLFIVPVFARQQGPKQLLRDGFVLSGVDGRLVARGEKWFFEFERDVTDGANVVKAGEKLEMLTSAGLEKMVSDLKGRPGASYRFFNAAVTKYKDRNFIFCDYFLPLTEVKPDKPQQETEKGRQKPEVTINEPNDAIVIPQEIIKKLQSRRIIRPERLKGKFELKQDSILANRMGLIIERSDGRCEFVFDALGRNMPKVSLELLPCRALQRAERKQASDPGRRRYRVSGVVTKYKDRYYLLLQQAVRAYGHGNFGT